MININPNKNIKECYNEKLEIKGTMNFSGFEIPNIYGGFGEGQKVVLAKTVAEIHEVRLNDIQTLINENLDEFEFGIDLIDLKVTDTNGYNFEELGFTKMQIAKSKNIYLLSEQGYMALVGLMRTEKAKELRKKFRREYFAMREIINSDEQLRAKLLLSIYNGGQEGIIASKKLTELEVSEATKPLLEKIEEDAPKVSFAERILKDGDNILVRELAKIATDEGYKIGEKRLYNKLREWGYICSNSTEPTQNAMERDYFLVQTKIINTPYGSKQVFTTLITPKGQVRIVERLLKELRRKND